MRKLSHHLNARALRQLLLDELAVTQKFLAQFDERCCETCAQVARREQRNHAEKMALANLAVHLTATLDEPEA